MLTLWILICMFRVIDSYALKLQSKISFIKMVLIGDQKLDGQIVK
jgi:hypothetical protein